MSLLVNAWQRILNSTPTALQRLFFLFATFSTQFDSVSFRMNDEVFLVFSSHVHVLTRESYSTIVRANGRTNIWTKKTKANRDFTVVHGLDRQLAWHDNNCCIYPLTQFLFNRDPLKFGSYYFAVILCHHSDETFSDRGLLLRILNYKTYSKQFISISTLRSTHWYRLIGCLVKMPRKKKTTFMGYLRFLSQFKTSQRRRSNTPSGLHTQDWCWQFTRKQTNYASLYC